MPLRAAWNQQILYDAGFRQVECVWRWMNFAAWVAIKDGPAHEWQDQANPRDL